MNFLGLPIWGWFLLPVAMAPLILLVVIGERRAAARSARFQLWWPDASLLLRQAMLRNNVDGLPEEKTYSLSKLGNWCDLPWNIRKKLVDWLKEAPDVLPPRYDAWMFHSSKARDKRDYSQGTMCGTAMNRERMEQLLSAARLNGLGQFSTYTYHGIENPVSWEEMMFIWGEPT